MCGLRALPGILTTVLIIAPLGACSTVSDVKKEFFPDEEIVDYKKARTEPALEIPPDLTKSSINEGPAVPGMSSVGTATYSDYTRERSGGAATRGSHVLAKQENVRVRHAGKTYWLIVEGKPAEVWPKMRDFWLQSGFLVKWEDPRIGILETGWAENRADIPQDFIRRQISKIFDSLYSAATRDKYRVRLERGQEPGTTEVYLTHRGVEEVVENSTESTIWKPRPADPELEIEMLRRMAVFFGVEENESSTLFARAEERPERAHLVRDARGNATLNLKDEFARAWRRTGVALDRVGFTVEDRNRSEGVYYVRYIDPEKDANSGDEGWLDRLNIFSGDDDKEQNRYLVSLVGEGRNTRVFVLNEQGQPEKSRTADRILSLLHEQLK